MSGKLPEIAVIGGGIIGSWTALHLIESGVSTTLIEQFPIPHIRGSSHGQSRAFRFLGELELGRLDYSFSRWIELENICKERLFVKTGLLNFGPPGDADLGQYIEVLRKAGRACEWMGRKVIASRFPSIKYPAEWGAAWDPDGGILIANRCLTTVQSQFLLKGGRLMTAQLQSYEFGDSDQLRITVHNSMTGETQSLSFDRMVICAGPWTSKLVPELTPLLRSILTPVTYWIDRGGKYSASSGFPIIFNARLTDVYGLPSCEYPGHVKILYHGGPEVDPDLRDQVTVESLVEKVKRYVLEHLPGLDSTKPSILETCMYTMTPDNFPIIDRLAPNLVVGCGFSGSGFKHSPATGQMLAALALDEDDRIPEDYCADRYVLSRFK